MTGPAPISMLSDVLQVLLGDVAMLLCFFAPGYVAAWATDVMAFRSRSLPEKILWAIALSGPITIVITCYVARALPAGVIVALFQLAFVAALGLLARDLRSASRQRTLTFDRSFWIVVTAMLGVAIYCIAATLGITTQHSLYESIVMADWSIRVPLTEAAARGGLPPHNPMYALDGVAPPMRYYYFWYELCALIMRITHISARAALTATTAWSAYSLLSVLFLTIKYLGNLRTQPYLWPNAWPSSPATTASAPTASLRRICVMAMGLAGVMSLDLIMAVRYVLMRPPIVFPDIEAWHADRMPSWVGSILFAPHHIAGVAFGVLGFLLLAVLPAGPRQRATHALLAAVCFAALVGTSTYLCLCFAIAGLFLVLLRVRHRQWAGLTVIAVCAIVAVLIAVPFLREMTTSTGYSAAEHLKVGEKKSAIGNHMFKLVVSNWHASYGAIGDFYLHRGMHYEHNRFRYILPLFLMPAYFLMELSFYVFVIWYQALIDFKIRWPLRFRRGPRDRTASASLSTDADPGHRFMLWALFLGFALTGLFISSEPLQGINDLERHAGLALRVVLIAWAAPIFANVRLRLRAGDRPTVAGRWVIGLTTAMVFIGLGGQLWQVVEDRIYFALIAHGTVESKVWFGRGAPFLQIRRANDVIDANFPADAILQANPEGHYQALFLLYGKRQTAAGDEGCESAFGGSVDLCKQQVVAPLHRLFGGTMVPPVLGPGDIAPEPADPANMTAERFAETCRKLHLSVVVATKDDRAWAIPGTWVYTQPAIYADDATRVIPCPK